MLMRAERSCLILVDAQERLVPAVPGSAMILRRMSALIRAAKRIGVSVLASEHCPDRLGSTVETLRSQVRQDDILPKTSFAFPMEGAWRTRLGGHGQSQFLLAGFEAHVCVCQSALALLEQGREVYLIADAVGSIREGDRELALRRLDAAGARLVSTEMVLFEWLGNADHPAFKDILALLKELR